jgi:hypothetical protein
VLDSELKVYEANINKWKGEHRGEYVVIRGQDVLGFFPSENDALSAGSGTYGLKPFLVRKVGQTMQEMKAPALTLGMLFADY